MLMAVVNIRLRNGIVFKFSSDGFPLYYQRNSTIGKHISFGGAYPHGILLTLSKSRSRFGFIKKIKYYCSGNGIIRNFFLLTIQYIKADAVLSFYHFNMITICFLNQTAMGSFVCMVFCLGIRNDRASNK